MAGGKEIRNKIKSVQNTKKITKAMEMVAASKMRKAQERMRAGRPYAQKLARIAGHLAQASVSDFKHPFLSGPAEVKKVGVILVSTDKGLCGGLNTNLFRQLVLRMKEWEGGGVSAMQFTCIGNKGLGFMQRMGAKVVSNVIQLGDAPHMERLIGPVKVMIDAYLNGEVDAVFVAYNRFENTMKQEPTIRQMLPLTGEHFKDTVPERSWDYIYEPDAQAVIEEVLRRFIETAVYQSVAENMASEQSARMVAMKAASDNAGNVIKELQLVYNKTRQAAITKELSEIVSGAAAV
ncbi:F0F1 ATP synthase subunit gamma [Uliginosibacterium sp. H1]|uniref:F0F1 ATP synthase subunit gamma n=1 Tax=Uliginosibacterium sp. H1 TaxID=3114757 RepID=UPI00280660D8|nr:F0F1 ATP synthase subunit gamma [Moraxellaceae bacterium]MEC5398240.1 F0F1 ATP synthase subunit gamma [Uliginosibacterium sp. H1]